jgi:acetyl-CoA carboxylase carboxyltransferase component
MKILNKTEQINKRCEEIEEIIQIAIKERGEIFRQCHSEKNKLFKNQKVINYLSDRQESMQKVVYALVAYKNELKEQITD